MSNDGGLIPALLHYSCGALHNLMQVPCLPSNHSSSLISLMYSYVFFTFFTATEPPLDTCTLAERLSNRPESHPRALSADLHSHTIRVKIFDSRDARVDTQVPDT